MTTMTHSAYAPGHARQAEWRICGSSATELVIIALSFLWFLIGTVTDRSNIPFFVISGNLILSAGLGYGAYRCVIAAPAGIWVPIFWLRAAIIVYLGLGTIIPFMVNDLTRSVIDAFHATTDDQYLRSSMVTALGAFVTLSAATLTARVLPAIAIDRYLSRKNDPLLLAVGVAAAVVGFTCRYVIALPAMLGLADYLVPSMVINLSHFFAVSFFLLGLWCFRHRPGYVWIVFTMAAIDAIVGLLIFSKLEVLFSMLMAGLSLLHSNVSRTRLGIVIVTCVVTYSAIVPIVDFGRTVLLQRYERIEGADLGERLEILGGYFGTEGELFSRSEFRSEFQAGWARLSYSNQAAFAISQFDSNIPGDSIAQIPVAIVPRIFWPDKPNLNYIGLAFQEAATGSTTSLSWPGQFAEAYWNYGWLGILFCMFPLGVIYALASRYALRVYSQGRWIEFPILLLLMRWAMDFMTPIATNVVGGLLTIVFIGLFLRVLATVLLNDTSGMREGRVA